MKQPSKSDLSKPAVARVAAIAVAALLLLTWLSLRPDLKSNHHILELRAYFKDARGIRPGAPVRISGVDVGNVTNVRVRPERRGTPAEVLMRLSTLYSLQVPKDGVAALYKAGLLGETYVSIDIQRASGSPANNGDELRVREDNEAAEFDSPSGNDGLPPQQHTRSPQ